MNNFLLDAEVDRKTVKSVIVLNLIYYIFFPNSYNSEHTRVETHLLESAAKIWEEAYCKMGNIHIRIVCCICCNEAALGKCTILCAFIHGHEKMKMYIFIIKQESYGVIIVILVNSNLYRRKV